MSHFLFIAGALRERDSLQSAELQLAHHIWGLRSQLIRDNLSQYLTDKSCGLIYVLKVGICAQFQIISGVQSFERLDQFVRDELHTEARYGFVHITMGRRWASSSPESLALLHKVLEVPDQAELTRRLNLGMHRLTEEQYQAILRALG
jgi:hypothetical protein